MCNLKDINRGVNRTILTIKWSTIGIGFDGAETNCRFAHALVILLIISY